MSHPGRHTAQLVRVTSLAPYPFKRRKRGQDNEILSGGKVSDGLTSVCAAIYIGYLCDTVSKEMCCPSTRLYTYPLAIPTTGRSRCTGSWRNQVLLSILYYLSLPKPSPPPPRIRLSSKGLNPPGFHGRQIGGKTYPTLA